MTIKTTKKQKRQQQQQDKTTTIVNRLSNFDKLELENPWRRK